MQTKKFEVLLVEDDPGDVELTEAALNKSQLKINLHVVSDGEDALAYLGQEEDFSQTPSPHLILLDLNLPGLSGREVLQAIKSNQRIKHIPVVVFTTSDAEGDILKSYQLGANCYVTKPSGFKEFMNFVESIEKFWFAVGKLPHDLM